jgi:two-component system phosphate regulon sensor histidine kinase PhoR
VRKKKLVWQLFPAQILILTGVILIVSWYGSLSLRQFYVDQKIEGLEASSRLLLPQVAELYLSGQYDRLEEQCRAAGRPAATRITVVDPEGKVICDSVRDADSMENHGRRPEIATALSGEVGTSQRYSATTNQQMLYAAVPIISGNRIVGVLRTSIPGTSLDRNLRNFFWRIALGMLIVLALAIGVALLATRRISRPLEEMTTGALRYASGDFSRKISASGGEEVISLAQAMNRMAAELNNRLHKAVSQRNELETVLANMIEGVIAVDREARVLYLNAAAARQFDVSPGVAPGSNILAVVRNMELLRFIQKTLGSNGPVESPLVTNRGRGDERLLQLHGAQLVDAEKQRIGALIVTHDVTRLLRLENLRRDFVANVSHELKTPITSIKGYVETLLSEVEESQPHFREFLGIILKHANRLQAIVDDLLTLSRIEQDSRREEIRLEEASIKGILAEAIEACGAKGADRDIEISLHCPVELRGHVNPPLLEQAVINLLDNAIKYSPPAGVVQVTAEARDEEILIRVIDQGPGIPAEHLPRLFERFYVIDKARSRKLGGTGLGLSIVKHIVQSHRGRIGVESEPGRGSIFTITLPRSPGESPPADAPPLTAT